MKHVQKWRLNSSEGGSVLSICRRIRSHVQSNRSIRYPAQPLPPSGSAIRTPGKRFNNPLNVKSAHALMAFKPHNEIGTSKLHSGAVNTSEPDVPICIDNTNPVSC